MFNEPVCTQLGYEARQRGGERKASSVILSHLSSSFPPSQPEGLDGRPELHMTEEWLNHYHAMSDDTENLSVRN